MDEPTLTLQSDDDIGDWLYSTLTGLYAAESERWAIERMERIMDRLNDVRRRTPGVATRPLVGHIVWTGLMTAFTAPGRYVYITRELLQCFSHDEPVAFILGHEMAHQDLGHVSLLRPALEPLRKLPYNALLFTALWHVERLRYGTQQESDADRYGIDLCIAAGYDPYRCLSAFDAIDGHLLDHRDITGVYGPPPTPPPTTPLGKWISDKKADWERALRMYPSTKDRRAALKRHLALA